MREPSPSTPTEPRVDGACIREGIPIAPSLGPSLGPAAADVGSRRHLVDGRVAVLSAIAVVVAIAAGFIAQGLTHLIALVTNLLFYGRISAAGVSPADNHLGLWVVLVPTVGGLVVGLMARYGSRAIRGHGIPEAMEQVLTNESRIPARMTFLKPLSSAIAIGSGGPFGAEGPIIATGGALGSLVGQLLKTSATERKTLLAAGAAAGMAATFGSPVSAVLLAVELLLFEYRPRSLIVVALAAVTANGVRFGFVGSSPAFAMPDVAQPGGSALAFYVVLGAVMGLFSVLATRIVYIVEDRFEKLPIHWMWWPALGGLVVGIIGYVSPRTLGVGYDNIESIIGGRMVGSTMVLFCVLKFISWAVALGSGTSGGTLAPLLTTGAGLGSGLGALAVMLAPALGVDVRIAALVGMAALFAGASRALLTSVVFAFEATCQPLGLLPLLGGCASAFLVSCLLMRHSIMTEKIARRGVAIGEEYLADYLDQVRVRDHATMPATVLHADDTLASAAAWLASGATGSDHQGFPVVDGEGRVVRVVTRKDVAREGALGPERRLGEIPHRAPMVIDEGASLRDAADCMAREKIGRLPVVRGSDGIVVGIISRSDLIGAHTTRLAQNDVRVTTRRIGLPRRGARAKPPVPA